MHGHRHNSAWTKLAALPMLVATMLSATGCANERPPPPAQAIPCSVGDPPLTARDADTVSTPLARWLDRFIDQRAAACR